MAESDDPQAVNDENNRNRGETQRLRRLVLQVILVILVVLAMAWLLYALKTVLLLLVLTVFFCYLIVPLVDFIERPVRLGRSTWRVPHTLAVTIVYLILAAIVATGLELLLPVLSEQVSELVKNFPEYAKRLNQYTAQLSSLPARYRLPANWRQAITESINAMIAGGLEWVRLLAVNVVHLTFYLPWLVLIPIIGFFLLKDGKSFSIRLLSSLPEADLRWRAANFLRDVSEMLAAYIRAQLLACLIIGVIVGCGLRLLDVPYSLVLGVAAGLLEFIPVVGPLTLAVAAFLVASFQSWQLAFLVLGFLAVLRLIEDYVIYPRLIGRGVEMHPVVVILAVLCGAELGGVAGVFLSVPVAALLIVSWKHWRELQLARPSAKERMDAEERAALDRAPSAARRASEPLLEATSERK
jgi:predicted PurR-regulated permease PerM